MRKVLFLDIDGVLNPKWWVRKAFVDSYGYAFDTECIANLKRIIDETGADIVISSSWKCMGVLKLQRMWKDRGLPGRIVDVTPDLMSDELLMNEELANMDQLCKRGCEIKGWLMQHKDEEVQYVIIDDMDDILPEQQAYFIQVDPEIGLSEIDVMKAKLLFQKQEKESSQQGNPSRKCIDFWNKPNSEAMKEIEERQLKARAYEEEYMKKLKRSKK